MELASIDSTEQRIIEAAGRVFAEKGFGAATVREICSLASTNIASVNYYFGDKSKLYVECVMTAFHQRDAMLPLHEIDQSRPAVEELRRFIRAILCRVLAGDEQSWQARLLLHETLQPSQSAAPLLREYFKPISEAFVALLNRLRTHLCVERELDFELVVYTLVSQCLFFRVGRPFMCLLASEWERRPFDLEALTDHVTTSILGLFVLPQNLSSVVSKNAMSPMLEDGS